MSFCNEAKFNEIKYFTPRAMNYVYSTHKLTVNTSLKCNIFVDKSIDDTNGQACRLQHYRKM